MNLPDWQAIRAICAAQGLDKLTDDEMRRYENLLWSWGWRSDEETWTSKGLVACEMIRDGERLQYVLDKLAAADMPATAENVMGLIADTHTDVTTIIVP